jgi:hypothetical protein
VRFRPLSAEDRVKLNSEMGVLSHIGQWVERGTAGPANETESGKRRLSRACNPKLSTGRLMFGTVVSRNFVVDLPIAIFRFALPRPRGRHAQACRRLLTGALNFVSKADRPRRETELREQCGRCEDALKCRPFPPELACQPRSNLTPRDWLLISHCSGDESCKSLNSHPWRQSEASGRVMVRLPEGETDNLNSEKP